MIYVERATSSLCTATTSNYSLSLLLFIVSLQVASHSSPSPSSSLDLLIGLSFFSRFIDRFVILTVHACTRCSARKTALHAGATSDLATFGTTATSKL